jgi:hypothetical protein
MVKFFGLEENFVAKAGAGKRRACLLGPRDFKMLGSQCTGAGAVLKAYPIFLCQWTGGKVW